MSFYRTAVFGILVLPLIIGGVLSAEDGSLVKPIDSMHHFMEYVFEPRYKELKSVLAQHPADKTGWAATKAGGLTLAEAANLLMTRPPKEASKKEKMLWVGYAHDVRNAATALFHTARKKEFDRTRSAFHLMIQRCNACHQTFAEGKYQLDP